MMTLRLRPNRTRVTLNLRDGSSTTIVVFLILSKKKLYPKYSKRRWGRGINGFLNNVKKTVILGNPRWSRLASLSPATMTDQGSTVQGWWWTAACLSQRLGLPSRGWRGWRTLSSTWWWQFEDTENFARKIVEGGCRKNLRPGQASSHANVRSRGVWGHQGGGDQGGDPPIHRTTHLRTGPVVATL